MNSLWYAWDSEITESICSDIKSFFDAESKQTGKVGNNQIDKQMRTSTIAGFSYGTETNQKINEIIEPYIVMANSESFGFDLNGMREFQIAEYSVGNHYDNHFDMRLDDRASMRKLGVTVQLSKPSEYKGGEFMFSDDIETPNQDILKKQGTVIVFPSFIYHKVAPVTEGVRYSLVGWYEGSHWK